jgi:hypothetical protein
MRYRFGSSISSGSGYGTRVLMTKRRKKAAEIFHFLFCSEIGIYGTYLKASIKDAQAIERCLQYSIMNIQHLKR